MTRTNSKKIASGVAGLLTAVFLACPALAAPPATNAIPTGGTVVGGAAVATIGVGGTASHPVETITQSVSRGIIDWTGFDIGRDARVVFNQQAGNSSVTLNRITGNASQIYGHLSANGTIILANGNGIYFGNSAHVSVGGMIATASKISNADFNAGNYNFTPGTNPYAFVINNAEPDLFHPGRGIKTNEAGGLIAFLAPTVINNGLIEAKAGTVVMASGDTATFVDLYGDGLINLATNGEVESLLVENSGVINANGGDVRLTAGTAKTVVDSLINMDGLILAESVHGKGGKVTLEANAVEMKRDGFFHPATILADGGRIKITGFEGTRFHNVGVTLDGATVYAGNGNVFIWGKGYGNPEVFNEGSNYGVSIAGGSQVVTTGSRSILSIVGIGGNGMTGYDPAGNAYVADNNYGVYITGEHTRVASLGGNVMVAGFGGGLGAVGGSNGNHGVFMSDGAEVSSTGGDIFVSGMGGGNNGSSDNNGVLVTDDAGIASHTGDILITGIAGGQDYYAERGNYGIVLTDGGWVGGETLDGAVPYKGKAVVIAGHDHGDITFVTDTILFDESARVRTSGDVFFEPFSNWTTIGIAGAPGTLQLTETLLDDVYARSITIGNTGRDYGKITAYAYDWNMPVSILNGGRPYFSIDSDYGDIEIDGLQTIYGDNTFRAVTAWGDIIIREKGGISVGSTGPVIMKTMMVQEGEDTLVTLAASFGRFLNYAGPNAIQVPNGRWLVYSYGPVDDVFGGLDSGNAAIWGRVYNEHQPIYASGDRYIFTVRPTLTVTFDDMHKAYGLDNTPAVAVDPYTLAYTVRGLDHSEHDLLTLPGVVGDAFYLDTVEIDPRTSAGSPALAPEGDYPDIWGKVTSGAKGMHVVYKRGTLTVDPLNLNSLLDRSKAPARRGPNGTLLSIVNTPGYLANLAPAAGGAPGNLADLSPKAGGDMGDLANLSPQAGGGASITPLIQCNEVTPCDIYQ